MIKLPLKIYKRQLFCLSLALGIFVSGTLVFHANAAQLSVAQVFVNDPGFTLDPLNVDKQWSLAVSKFPEAWLKTTGASTTIVAIIDTGIDQTHEDFNFSSFVTGYDFISDKPIMPGENSDDNGHGTLVASVIASSPNNSLGITGGAPKASIMPIKALDKEGRGDSKAVARAINWAAGNGAQIINLSLGGSGFEHDEQLAKAIENAFNQGLLIVASAGNDTQEQAKDLDQSPVFPVCNDNNQNMVIGVTALDKFNTKPDFANFGKNCIDVAAPGRRILAAISIDPVTRRITKSGYAYVSGTSFSAALVTAQAALIKSFYPNATNRQIRDRIIATSASVDRNNLAQCLKVSCLGRLGAGLIDAAKSLEEDFPQPNLVEGELIKAENLPQVYWFFGGQKRLVSPMVFNQRFLDSPIKILPFDQLEKIPSGPYATPQEGTLIKVLENKTVYQIANGLKLPITAQVFFQRGYKFSDIKIADSIEAATWVTGKFLAPKEGTLVKTPYSSQLYWTVSGSLHKINKDFFERRGLKIFPLFLVTRNDFLSYNIGEEFK